MKMMKILKSIFYVHFADAFTNHSVTLCFLLKHCESNPLCRKLSLQGIISSSYQRLTKYPLFIEGLIKATPGKLDISPKLP